MNSDWSTPYGATTEDVRRAQVAALEALRARDKRWQLVPAPHGATLTRRLDDGTTDILSILSPETTYARREDPTGHEITAVRGTAEGVVSGVLEWLAPGALAVLGGTDHLPGPDGMRP